ncbi:MAG: helix-turn-helix domain-containing protein [Candidatus Latescibacteria bacterium]|nr:helix-turn-helix domain-containing protein [Candidatus Latescibacterota bacterium]
MGKIIKYGQRVQELREKNRMTQGDLAYRIDTIQSEISKIERSEKEPGVGIFLRFADVFKMSVLDLAKGTNLESFIKNERLYPRFCPHHDPMFVVRRIRDGFESKFCPDCGKKLEGDCPRCGTPRGGVGDQFCEVCGCRFTTKIEGNLDLLSEVGFAIDEEYGYYDSPKFIYQAKICITKKHDHNPDQEEFIWFPTFGFAGELNFCPFCGKKLISSCSQCGKPIVRFGEQKTNFCDGCGRKFNEAGKGTEASSST